MARAGSTALPRIAASDARRLLLDAQGLLADPAVRATPAAVHRRIERIGFVQVDTISVVERAHHHILASRFDDYEPRMLTKLLERDRKLFEHWTHDASVIPTRWLPWWRQRFRRHRMRGCGPNAWWRQRIGPNADGVLAHVRERIACEGPLMSKDFEHDRRGESSGWWRWKPQKAALEHLWRCGELTVSHRVSFQKVYDLTTRVFPDLDLDDGPDEDEHVAWACREVLIRLGVATPTELAAFFRAITADQAKAWCRGALATGEVVEVEVDSEDGGPVRRSVAPHDWRRRLGRAPEPPARMRLLSPFDPVVRDRHRAARLFGFEYRFEAFVPAAKRRYGYYVLPILEGDRFVGRVDPKLHRDRGDLEIRGVWWEPKVRVTRARRTALEDAVDLLAHQVGAETWTLPVGG